MLYKVIHVHFTDGSDKASDSTSEKCDHEDPRPTRKSGELLHDKASFKDDRNRHKRERSRSMKDSTDSFLEAKSRKVKKIAPTSDTSPPHKEAKRSKSKRERKQKSADSPKHYGKKSARKNSSPDDPTLLDSPHISSMKQQREERAIVGSRVLGSPMEESESVMNPRRHISPHGSGRSHAGTYVGEKCIVHIMCM